MLPEMDLEARDAGDGVARGTNFGREVGEGGDVGASESGDEGEDVARELDAVARIAREADDEMVVINGLKM